MIGDAYMVLAGGPIPSQHHAESITNFGLGILEETASIIDPSTSDHLRIRVGESVRKGHLSIFHRKSPERNAHTVCVLTYM